MGDVPLHGEITVGLFHAQKEELPPLPQPPPPQLEQLEPLEQLEQLEPLEQLLPDEKVTIGAGGR